jgi:Ni,Fe-hydrogenase III large subunit
MPERGGDLLRSPCDFTDGGRAIDGSVVEGRAVGWAEAPQGEVIYDVTLESGRIARCQ